MSKVRAEMCFVFKDLCYCNKKKKEGDYSETLHGVMKCENSIKPPPHLLPPAPAAVVSWDAKAHAVGIYASFWFDFVRAALQNTLYPFINGRSVVLPQRVIFVLNDLLFIQM